MGVLLRRGWRMPVLLVLASGLLLLQAVPASAVLQRGPVPHRLTLLARSSTSPQLTLSNLGPGTNVNGYIADANNPFNSATTPYPSDIPPGSPLGFPAGFTPRSESFAGVILATPTGGAANSLSLYCIDINTLTYIGNGYTLGTWGAANVPNVGYVARLLDEYYPNTNEPASLTNLAPKAAAVQAAIWYFSDKYVLKTSDPLYTTVAGIVAAVQKAGPLVEPPPPSLTITPSDQSGPAGRALGPFTIKTNHPPASVTATGATMSKDQAGTMPIANGDTVPDGQQIWLHSTGPSSAVLQATSEATVPSGNVYLYDGGADQAQKLILAQPATLTTTVSATGEFLAPGSLVVKKTIAGPAAGSQGRVVIHVGCDDGVDRPDLVVDAGAHAGTTPHTYGDIPAGTRCTVTETSDGGNATTSVVVTGDGQQVTIPSGNSATVEITDTYDFVPGSLLVRKTIAGPAAGQQQAITIHTVCDGKARSPDFVIAAGTPAGDYTKQYDQIPVNAKCTVTETADGHTSAVSVVVTGSGQTVTVPAGTIVDADLGDTYGLVPGQLEVTKTITGPQAGQQGPVVIHTVCTPAATTPDFTISAGATGVQSQIYSGIPAGAKCVVTETANGQTAATSVSVTGSGQTATIPPGGAAAADITDTYGAVPGSLLVTKTIAGPFAGHQGSVTIRAACTGAAPADFVITAGAPAGKVSHSFDGIPADSVCTVTETADGATATVMVTVSGDGQTVAVPAGKVVAVSLTDVYQGRVGSVKVTKHITGAARHLRGRIAILVACGGPLHHFAFIIRAHVRIGSASRYFDGIPAGARCTVLEVATGRTSKVAVLARGRRHKVTIRANGTATVHLRDVFAVKAVTVTRPPAVTG